MWSGCDQLVQGAGCFRMFAPVELNFSKQPECTAFGHPSFHRLIPGQVGNGQVQVSFDLIVDLCRSGPIDLSYLVRSQALVDHQGHTAKEFDQIEVIIGPKETRFRHDALLPVKVDLVSVLHQVIHPSDPQYSSSGAGSAVPD